jgi:hypothetical protein
MLASLIGQNLALAAMACTCWLHPMNTLQQRRPAGAAAKALTLRMAAVFKLSELLVRR